MRISLFFVCLSACSGLRPAESPDGRDCDERSIFFQDTDGDGFGADDHILLACEETAGWSETGGDCDDTDADITVECHQFDTGSQDTGDSGDTATEPQ